MKGIICIHGRHNTFDRGSSSALMTHTCRLMQTHTFDKTNEAEWEAAFKMEELSDEITAGALHHGEFQLSVPGVCVAADVERMHERIKCEDRSIYDGAVCLQSDVDLSFVSDRQIHCVLDTGDECEEIMECQECANLDSSQDRTDFGHSLSIVGGTLLGVGVTVTAVALTIPLAGFGAGGIAAGSIAATAQSMFYGGAAAGVFSFLQSAGATMAWVGPSLAGGVMTATGSAMLAGSSKKDEMRTSS